MAENKIKKKDIFNEAKQLLKNGNGKQEAFETLSRKYIVTKEVADIITYIPSQAAIKKYGIWNYVLLGVLIIIPAIILMGAPPNVALLYFMLLIYIVVKRFVRYYSWIAVIAAVFLVSMVGYVFVGNTHNVNWIQFGELAGANVILLVLSLLVQAKLCPLPIESKEEIVTKDGDRKLKIKYQFKD